MNRNDKIDRFIKNIEAEPTLKNHTYVFERNDGSYLLCPLGIGMRESGFSAYALYRLLSFGHQGWNLSKQVKEAAKIFHLQVLFDMLQAYTGLNLDELERIQQVNDGKFLSSRWIESERNPKTRVIKALQEMKDKE